MPENELQHETSPYLLQHKDNPVHWMAWGDAAFAGAKAEKGAFFCRLVMPRAIGAMSWKESLLKILL